MVLRKNCPDGFFRSTSKYSLSHFLASQLDAGIQMRILSLITTFPAQFRRLAPALAEQGHDVIFLAQNREWHAPPVLASGSRVRDSSSWRRRGAASIPDALNLAFSRGKPSIALVSS